MSWTSLLQLFSSVDDLGPVAFSDGQGHEKVLWRRTQSPGRQALLSPFPLWTTKGLGMVGSKTLILLALRQKVSESLASESGLLPWNPPQTGPEQKTGQNSEE